jgi:2-phospho-L-lactate guanylyltransferase (CobY/MobA/RfbA family)
MHALLEHIPSHEQMFIRNVIVPMEMYAPLVIFASPLPCIDTNKREHLSGLFLHGNNKHQEWKSKNACQATMSDGWTFNLTKGMCKTC